MHISILETTVTLLSVKEMFTGKLKFELEAHVYAQVLLERERESAVLF